jgi:alkylated DNA repair protein (DNA oxidative demethylase)
VSDLLSVLSPDPVAVSIAPGVAWLRHWLPIDRQARLAAQCREMLDGPAGGYVPRVRGGGLMRVRMTCLGRHWNATTYEYEPARTDHDGLPAAPIPDEWTSLASALAREAGFALTPDICILNWYDAADGRMGLHQDKSERPESLEAGHPVVSISIGATARFLLGGLRRRDPVDTIALESGDVFIFGGPARLRYHGVTRILPGTAPAALGLTGRFNLTFRQY